MNNFTKALLASTIIGLSASALAQDSSEILDAIAAIQDQKDAEAKVYSQETREGLEKKGAIIGIKEIPISKLFFVEAELGSYLVSADGRFVIQGSIKDVWHRKTLSNLGDLEGIDRVPVSANAKKIEETMVTYTIGSKALPRSGVIFVDPSSDITVTALQKLYELKDEQRWVVVIMPVVGGANALDRSRRIHCAVDQDQAKMDLINGTNESFGSTKKDCGAEKLLAAQFVTNVFGITQMPHMIREDGLVSEGFPVEFGQWFKQP
jgi:thiol:disulfide interchange protein DsbC